MTALITYALSNFTLTFLAIGLVASLMQVLLRWRSFSAAYLVDALLRWFLFFSIGVSFFYNFVMHVFFGAMAARFIGWADSPFQAEVGYASLGFAAIGLLAFKGNCCVRFAAILGPAMFQWGAAVGHIHDMLAYGNYAPGNAGIMLYSDILLPLIGFGLLWLKRIAGAPSVARAA